MEMIGYFPKVIVLLLIYLYIIFFMLIIIVSVIHQIVLRNRRVGNPKKITEDHIYKIYIRGTTWLSLRSTSEVWISLQSEKGSSDFFVLPSKHNILSTSDDESLLSFSIETNECLEELQYMTLLVREKGFCAWHVDSIIVEDVQHESSYEFNFFSSLEISFKVRMYIASCPQPFLPTFVLKCVKSFLSHHNWISSFVRFKSVLEVSNNAHLLLIFAVFLQSLLLGVMKETIAESNGEQMFLPRLDAFIILYLSLTTLIPDFIIHAAKMRNRYNKNVWNYETLEKSKQFETKVKRSSQWLESLERLNLEHESESEQDKLEESEFDKLSREIDLTEADVISVDSLELETLTEQRFSAISSVMTPADIAQLVEDTDVSDTMSWMSFYDQESPFFTVSSLEKYTQFNTLFQPFKPKQLVRNRISLWIHFLQKWHKVQLRSIRTYRMLYAFWWRWQELDIDMSLLQREMNKIQKLVLQFQTVGQKIRDSSVWLELHPLWRTAIELPQDEHLIAPFEPLIELVEQVVVHVMTNFVDHYNVIQKHRTLSRDIEWFIEDWFRELLEAFLSFGYLTKSETLSEDTDHVPSYWLPPTLAVQRDDYDESLKKTDNLIRVVPGRRRLDTSFDERLKKQRSFIDLKVAKTWYSWLPHLIREIGDHIIQEVQERTMGLSLVDAVTYMQMQKEGCVWEEACTKIMGIMADVILQDIIKYMCVFLPAATKRVLLQRTRATLADCLKESAKPWSSIVESGHDLTESQHQYTLISILKGCVSRCKAAPLSEHDLASEDPMAQANKVRLLFLLPDELTPADLHNEQLIPRLNSLAITINDRINRLKLSVGLIRQQFDANLSKHALSKERVHKIAFAGVINTLLVLCRLETMISHVELCRDAIELDIPITTMIGDYNRINFRQVFRLLASHYGQSRLGKRSVVQRSQKRGSTRVHAPGTVKLERRHKDCDLDVIQLLLHPCIPPLHYIWGLIARLYLTVEIIALPTIILDLSTELPESSFMSVGIVMGIGALMDFAFIQPIKCFLIVLWQRYWEKKGVFYVYQKNPFTC